MNHDSLFNLHAACRDMPAEVFFVEKGDDGGEARAVCAGCPVVVDCLQAALERGEEFGIWGGAGESTRRFLARAWHDRKDNPRRWSKALADHLRSLRGEAGARVVDRNTENATHGLRATYARGCRCRPCCFAAAMNSRDESIINRTEAS